MKKKVLGLLLYTVVVMGIAWFFHEHYFFEMGYVIIIGVLFMFILSQLMPGIYMSSGRVEEHLEFRSLDTVPKGQKFADIDLVGLLMLLYLVVPFMLSLYLF